MERQAKVQCAAFLLLATLATSTGDDGNVTMAPSSVSLSTPSCYRNDSCSQVGENVVECDYNNQLTRMFCPYEPPSASGNDNSASPDSTCTFISREIEYPPSYCTAVVTTLCPRFGPAAGGSHLTVWGHGFVDIPGIIYLSMIYPCVVRFSNSTLIECVTQYTAGQADGSSLSLDMTYRSGCVLREPDVFTYRGNPDIETLNPITTIVSGGVPLTVSGANMDSIARPILNIHTNTSETFSTVCDVINSTAWSCPYPDLRQSRDTSRSARDTTVNGDVAYEVGFSLDGVVWYNRASFTLGPGAGTVTVVDDPVVLDFDQGLIEFRPAWPDNYETITIEGDIPSFLMDPSSVSIRIGAWPCEIVNISLHDIVCKPPDGLPDGQYSVEVQIANFLASPGQLRCDRSPWGNHVFAGAVIGAIVLVVVVLVVVVLVLGVRHRCRGDEAQRKMDAERASPSRFLLGEYLDPGVSLMKALSKPLQKQINACSVLPSKFKEGNIVLTGHFGQVGNGWVIDAKGIPINKVTFKGFKEKGAPFRTIVTYLKTALPFRGLKHENVLPVLGVAIFRNAPTLLYAHTEHGDLKQFLAKIRDSDINPEVKELLQLAMNAADGMAYLTDKGHLHGDLAARTCRVDSHAVLRICDSALAQDLYADDYQFTGEKQAAKPIKWMAPELIDFGIASVKTEIWSFGVLVWEIMTLGETPYPELTHTEAIAHLRKGNRLSRPYRAPVALYTMMTHCWAKDPNRRQTFGVLSRKLLSLITGQFRPSQGDISLTGSGNTINGFPGNLQSNGAGKTASPLSQGDVSLTGSGNTINGLPSNVQSNGPSKTASSDIAQSNNDIAKSDESIYANTRKKSVQFKPEAAEIPPPRLPLTDYGDDADDDDDAGDRGDEATYENTGYTPDDTEGIAMETLKDDDVGEGHGTTEADIIDPKSVPLRLLETSAAEDRPDFTPSNVQDADVAIYF